MKWRIDDFWIWWVAGICCALAIVVDGFWWLGLLGIALFFTVLINTKNLKSLVLGTLIFATIKSAGGLVWMWYTYPLDWLLPINPGLQLGLIGLYWFLSSLALGAGFSFCLIALYKLARKPRWIFILLLPFVFVIGEIVGSLVFSLFWLGPGSNPNVSFSFGYIGYQFSHLAVLYPFAKAGGVYAISLMVGILGICLAGVIHFQGKFRKISLFLTAIVLLVIFGRYIISSAPTVALENITVIAVDTRFDNRSESSAYTVELVEAVKIAVGRNPNIVLLPEDSRLISNIGSSTVVMELFARSSTDTIIVDSARTRDGNQTVQRAFVFDLGSNSVGSVDKQYLVPQGEYVPYVTSVTLTLLGQSELKHTLITERSYRPGSKKDYSEVDDDVPGILFCFSVTSPTGVSRASKNRDSQIVLHPISHGWFNNPVIMWRQFDEMLRVQAIWSGKSVVSAGNMVSGKVYLPNGVIEVGRELMNTKSWRLVEYNL